MSELVCDGFDGRTGASNIHKIDLTVTVIGLHYSIYSVRIRCT